MAPARFQEFALFFSNVNSGGARDSTIVVARFRLNRLHRLLARHLKSCGLSCNYGRPTAEIKRPSSHAITWKSGTPVARALVLDARKHFKRALSRPSRCLIVYIASVARQLIARCSFSIHNSDLPCSLAFCGRDQPTLLTSTVVGCKVYTTGLQGNYYQV